MRRRRSCTCCFPKVPISFCRVDGSVVVYPAWKHIWCACAIVALGFFYGEHFEPGLSLRAGLFGVGLVVLNVLL